VVGDYCGLTLADAKAAIEADGFTYGGTTVSGATTDWFVETTNPPKDAKAAPGFPISVDAASVTEPTCP
jgi:hypothetical protein